MSLELSATSCITTGCKKLNISDTSGIYSEEFNSGGWGFPNIDPSDIINGTLSIIMPGSDIEYTIDITSVLQAVILPTSYVPGYTIPLGEFDLSNFGGLATEKFSDGKYTITYTIITETEKYTCTFYFYSFCNVCCCVNKMLSNAIEKAACNKCDSRVVQDALFARALLLKGQQFSASYWDFDKAESIRKQAEKLCDFNDCSC